MRYQGWRNSRVLEADLVIVSKRLIKSSRQSRRAASTATRATGLLFPCRPAPRNPKAPVPRRIGVFQEPRGSDRNHYYLH